MAVPGVDSIEQHFVDEYSTTLQLLSQQRKSKFREYVTLGSHTGEGAAPVNQYGEADGQEVTTRHGDTPLNPVSRDRRWVYHQPYDTADLVDKFDELQLITDAKSGVAQAQAAYFGRTMDDIILEAMDGTAKTGQKGGTDTSFTATQSIASGSAGLTIDKIRQGVRKFWDNDVDLDSEMLVGAITPEMKENLLATTEVTSADYNTVRALVQGDIDTFMGVKWIHTTRAPGLGTDSAKCFLWVPSGLHLGIWQDVMAEIDRLPTKRYSWQVYACMDIGASRIEEKKVVRIYCDES